jgi:hypothetical protein
MEILRTKPEEFCRLIGRINTLLALANPPKGTTAENTRQIFIALVPTLLPAIEEARNLGLLSTISQLKKIGVAVDNSSWSGDEMVYDLRSLRDRMRESSV